MLGEFVEIGVRVAEARPIDVEPAHHRVTEVEGDIAGEISLLNGLRATATVAASRKTAVALLNRKNFEALLKEQPKLRDFLDELSARRLKGIGEAMRPAEILDADELVVE